MKEEDGSLSSKGPREGRAAVRGAWTRSPTVNILGLTSLS